MKLEKLERQLNFEIRAYENLNPISCSIIAGLQVALLYQSNCLIITHRERAEVIVYFVLLLHLSLYLSESPNAICIYKNKSWVSINTVNLSDWELYNTLLFEFFGQTEITLLVGEDCIEYLSSLLFYIVTPFRHDAFYLRKQPLYLKV